MKPSVDGNSTPFFPKTFQNAAGSFFRRLVIGPGMSVVQSGFVRWRWVSRQSRSEAAGVRVQRSCRGIMSYRELLQQQQQLESAGGSPPSKSLHYGCIRVYPIHCFFATEVWTLITLIKTFKEEGTGVDGASSFAAFIMGFPFDDNVYKAFKARGPGPELSVGLHEQSVTRAEAVRPRLDLRALTNTACF